jgi:predicted AAA+ superfamily ATPase
MIQDAMIETLKTGQKIVVIYGARQTGKTTLAKKVIEELGHKTLLINADQQKYIDVLSSRNLNKLKALTDGYEMVFIDEAQRIPDIGINLKIMNDELPALKIIATGSSSFDLAKQITEPLTGRKKVFKLLSISQQELLAQQNKFELASRLNEFLVYGSYPEVAITVGLKEKQEIIEEIGNSYLLKDIIELTNIKYPNKARDLLRLLAFQVGSQVSIQELSNSLKLNHETVNAYITLFEKSFIVFRLSGFSRNLRKEVSKMDKIYFWDTGIRNLLINNFSSLDFRNDQGQLFENFIISERLKYLSNNRISANTYFWRTYTGSELDYVEEKEGKLSGFEIKYGKKKPKAPKIWTDTYRATYHLINGEDYLDFLT